MGRVVLGGECWLIEQRKRGPYVDGGADEIVAGSPRGESIRCAGFRRSEEPPIYQRRMIEEKRDTRVSTLLASLSLLRTINV